MHELIHNYANPLVDQHWSQMEQASEAIYPHVAEAMAQRAYQGAETVMKEWLTNLCMLMCYREMQPELLDWLTAVQQQNGFVWMGRSVKLMDEFYADRERYPHLSDFMLRIVEFVKQTAVEFDQVQQEYNAGCPQIVEVTPAVESSVSADNLPSEVVVRFSEPMNMSMYGANWLERADVMQLPTAGKCIWRDEYTLVFPLKTESLEKGKTYGFKFLSQWIQSAKGRSIPLDAEIWFKVE